MERAPILVRSVSLISSVHIYMSKDAALTRGIAMDKQKMLLSADVGHFSLVRAMHLADLITLMNGKYGEAVCQIMDVEDLLTLLCAR